MCWPSILALLSRVNGSSECGCLRSVSGMLRRPELVMMVVSVFSLTGGELAGGGLGVIPHQRLFKALVSL